MEQDLSVISLMIVVGVAFFVPIILHRFRLNVIPVVAAEIIAGIIIGKTGFNIVHPDEWLEILSSLGFIFLMFLSGLEIDFKAFTNKSKARTKNKGPNTFMISSIVFSLILGISVLFALFFNMINFSDNVLFMVIIISTISLGVVVPTLKESGLIKTEKGQIILLISVIADLLTMLLLVVFVSKYSDSSQSMWLLLLLFGAGVGLYFIGKRFKGLNVFGKMTTGSIQIDTRAIFALIIILVGLSETVGAENILGAFLAGALISLLSPSASVTRKLDSFGYGFLIPIFFVMVGVELDLLSVVSNPKSLLFIPVLLIALWISKAIPSLLLKKWYPWKVVMGTSFLLTSTLSLVIASAKIGESIEVISSTTSSSLILVAVISCVIFPVLFNKIFPFPEKEKQRVTIIGANRVSLPVSLDLQQGDTEVTLFSLASTKVNDEDDHDFPIIELDDVSVETLEDKEAFDTDVLVTSLSDEQKNIELAKYGKGIGIDSVIVRAENPITHEALAKEGYGVYSTLYSTRMLLKAMISNPSLIKLITSQQDNIREISLNNTTYANLPLRRIPYLGNTLILQVFRNGDSIIPNGDTVLETGDKLLVSGNDKSIMKLKFEFET